MDLSDENFDQPQGRKTRSGRTPAPPKPKQTTRKTRKKMVLMEVEVSDEEELTTGDPLRMEESNKKEEMVDENGLQQDEGESEPQTKFVMEIEEISEKLDEEISDQDKQILGKEEDIIEKDEKTGNEIENEPIITMPLDGENDEKNNVNDEQGITFEEIEGVNMSTNNKFEEEKEMEEDNGKKREQIEPKISDENYEMEEKDEYDEINNVKSEKTLLQPDPDTENISEDELPSVQVVKVPETEEVSDEELPGPKRAELPADTEVVSEDELPAVKRDGGTKRKLTEGDYDPGSPTSESEISAKKPFLDQDDLDQKEKEKEKPKKLPELDKYWKAVNDDPTDFTGWTYLLQYVDQENDMEAAREAYDAFLSHYPYCYGYWRKYADYEKRKGNKKKCEEVFERGLKAIPLSVDLWIHYLTYVRTMVKQPEEDEEFTRAQFERALAACGLEFRSDRLWESYIKWENEAKRYQHATAIYDRLLSTPTQGYITHFDNFQEHVSNNTPNKILEVDEFLALRKEVKHILKHDGSSTSEPTGTSGDKSDLPPGEDREETSSDEETKAIRERIISIRRKIHKNTSTAVTSRWNFEEGIKRPYFHVKPLERCQLKNWQEYLNFEIEQGDQTRIIVLFERCLIACALYEEFWLRFVHYLEGLKDTNLHGKIKDVYERACTIHHIKKPTLHLQWAMFEESIKNFNKSAEILVNIEKSVPNLLQIAYRRINLERRRGDYEKCSQLYEHYITNSKNKVISTNLAIKYARFALKILNNLDKAFEVINMALSKDPNNSRLYLQLIDLTMHKNTSGLETEILGYLDTFLEKESVEIDQKVLFAQRKLEFLEDFGSDILSVQSAYDEYQKCVKLSKENKKKDGKDSVKKDKMATTSEQQASNSYGSYGNYSNSSGNASAYQQYAGSQQGQYNYTQYGQGDQYQYGSWQYPQGSYSGYNQWSGYGSGYGY
ncbi:pre-mRNA-processing factor 39 [Onthophagus taurus]|uniref:pre-mRNA-processing factor 39 n=1 Tax=Onthophagus taurus TaxID=166361 RepID=UPI000C20EDBF|nr:pre-mRNA-processing factor 39 [Onthophagus taurus]